MNEPDVIRPAEPLLINILRLRNLKGVRGDTVTAFVKVEHNDKLLGESTKIECTLDSDAELNFQTTINVSCDDYMLIDDIVSKPVVCTIIEALPKEKKQKEEKTVPLGQFTIDLLPVVLGQTKFNNTLTVFPLPGSPIETLPADHPQPQIDYELSMESEILSHVTDSNVVSMTVETLFSPPDSFNVSMPNVNYLACMQMPITSEKESLSVFAPGLMKPSVANDKEHQANFKKWPIPATAVGMAANISDSPINQESFDEQGELRSKTDKEFRSHCELEKSRVVWNIEKRCYLEPGASKTFQDKIAKNRFCPLEICRMPVPGGAKTNKREDEISYHGVVYVDLAPLLYPGISRVRGAYKVKAFSENDVLEKTGKKGQMCEEATKMAIGWMSRAPSSPFGKPAKGAKEDKKEAKKGFEPSRKLATAMGKTAKNTVFKKTDNSGELAAKVDQPTEGEVTVINTEGMHFEEANSYIMLDIKLNKPLIPRKELEELAKNVAAYIPPRPKFPKRTDNAKKAVDDFHSQVSSVAALIIDEFRLQLQEHGQDIDKEIETTDSRYQELLYRLNSSGKYFAFKEQLKYSIIKIVREKLLKTQTLTDDDEMEKFLSELYVYLIDEMHCGLNNYLNVEDQVPVAEPLTTCVQLKHFAKEAESNQVYDLAAKYYQERIARDRNDPDYWFDYGVFCLGINDTAKAEECFKESIAIDQHHLDSIFMYAITACMQEKFDVAQLFFDTATRLKPENVICWTLLSLFYKATSNEIGQEMALSEATKLMHAMANDEAKQLRSDMAINPINPDEQINADSSATRQISPATALTNQNDSKSNKINGGSSGTRTKSALQKKQSPEHGNNKDTTGVGAGTAGGGGSSANKNKMDSSRPQSTKQTGKNAQTTSDADEESGTAVQSTREKTPSNAVVTSIYYNLIPYLIDRKAYSFAERALAQYLVDPYGGPSAFYYLCLSQVKLERRQYDLAEQSLKEALQYEHQNADVWALTGHVMYLTGRTEEAKDCYERTLAFVTPPTDVHPIFLRLAAIYMSQGRFTEAKNTFLQACRRSPTCVTWLGVGIACYRLDELDEAEEALTEANILHNLDPEVWAYLSLVCLKTGRQVEAEQAYKYAIKLNLSAADEELIEEIHRTQSQVGYGNPQF